jgi:hypothetical protein
MRSSMDLKLEDQLRDKYPTFFPPLGISLECGEGWYKILDTCLGYLDEEGFCGHASQIKEKYGTLRIYVDQYCICGQAAEENTAYQEWQADKTEKRWNHYELVCTTEHPPWCSEDAWGIINRILSEAEEASEHTCEECGKPGRHYIDSGHWHYTRCEECWTKMGREELEKY